MEAEDHVFLNGVIKSFVTYGAVLKKMADEIGSLRNSLVEYENKAANMKKIVLDKSVELDGVEKQIREKRVLMDASVGQLRDDLERRRNEVADREARMVAREAQIRTQQEKLDNILSAAEVKNKVGRPKKEEVTVK